MDSKGSWVLKIDPDVYKDLSKFPKDHAKKILGIIEDLPSNPYFGDIEKIKGERHLWRRRIGSYRIFYDLYPDKNLIHVFWVERRTSKTY
ncbi:MAG: type II toxin-antitoxin system RelE/ParE family toxin [bacterium]|nr:type II toxin-antitoxin system RelE/ParE family toxin [bacterium]